MIQTILILLLVYVIIYQYFYNQNTTQYSDIENIEINKCENHKINLNDQYNLKDLNVINENIVIHKKFKNELLENLKKKKQKQIENYKKKQIQQINDANEIKQHSTKEINKQIKLIYKKSKQFIHKL